MTNQQGAPEALRLADDLEASSLFPGNMRSCNNAAAAELRRLHAQVAALTAATEVQDEPGKDKATCQMCGEKPYPGCNSEFQDEAACRFYHPAAAQTALAHELFAAAQLAPGEGIEDAVLRLAALVEAQQPTAHVKNQAEIEHVAGDVSKNGPESNMAQQAAPSAAVVEREALHLALTALENSKPTHDHYPEPRERHVKAIAAVRAALSTQQPAPATQQPAPSAAAARSLSDGQRALHEAILNRLSHAELLEKAHYLMELNSNQARTIGELQDLVEAAPQPSPTPQADSQPAPVRTACWACNGTGMVTTSSNGSGLIDEKCQACSADRAPADSVTAPAGDFHQFTTGDEGLDELLNETFNLARGPKHNNMDTAMVWKAALDEVLTRLALTPTDNVLLVPRETLVAWRQWCAQSMSHAIEHEISDVLSAAPAPPTQAADSVLEDAAREAIDKVLALFPFNAPIQTFTIGGGPCLTADGDTEFYSAKRIWALLREVKTTLDAARKQGANP